MVGNDLVAPGSAPPSTRSQPPSLKKEPQTLISPASPVEHN